jgi:uncharacterized protein involved in tolerance to divalent cations
MPVTRRASTSCRVCTRCTSGLQAEDEVLLLIKTPSTRFPALREALVAQHPYELPEVIAVGIEDGHHPYLDWLADPRGPSRASGP